MESKLQTLYEEAGRQHRFFLNWRYGIFAGYLAISMLLYQEILKSGINNDCWLATVGVFISIIFFLLHLRTTVLYRKCQDTACEIEKEIIKEDTNNSSNGIFSNILCSEILGRKDVDASENTSKNKNDKTQKNTEKPDLKSLFLHLGHTAVINWTIVLSGVVFLLCLIRALIQIIC